MTQNKNMTQNSLKIIRKRKEKEGGKRGEKKKRLLTLIIFAIPTKKKTLAAHWFRRLNRGGPFSKIQVDI